MRRSRKATLKTCANVAWATDFVASNDGQSAQAHMTEWSRSNGIQLDGASAIALCNAARLETIREAPAEVRESYIQHLCVAQQDACGVLDFFRTVASPPKGGSNTIAKPMTQEDTEQIIRNLLIQLQAANSKLVVLEEKVKYLEARQQQAPAPQRSGPATIVALPPAVRAKSGKLPPTSPLPPTPTQEPAQQTPPPAAPQRAGPPPPPPAPIFGRPKVPARSPPSSPRTSQTAPKPPARDSDEKRKSQSQGGGGLFDSEAAKDLLRRAQLLQGNDPKTTDTDDWDPANGSLDEAMSNFTVYRVCEAGQIHSKCF